MHTGKGSFNRLLIYSWPDLFWLVGVALGYAMLAHIALNYFSTDVQVISLIWAPSGLAVAALLIGGKKYWPGIFLGALAGNLMAGTPIGLLAVVIAIGNTLEALACVYFLTSIGSFDTLLRQPKHYLWLTIAGAVSACVSALIGTTALETSGFITDQANAFLHWWQGDLLGIILVTPLMLVWRKLPEGWFRRERAIETLTCFGLAFCVGQIIFFDWFPDLVSSIAQDYWMFLFVIWGAARFGPHGALLIITMTSAQALLGVANGIGYFATDIEQTGLLNIWVYILILALAGVTLALLIQKIQLTEKALLNSDERHRHLIRSTDSVIWTTDGSGGFVTPQISWEEFTGQTWDEHKDYGWTKAIHPEDVDRVAETWGKAVTERIPYESYGRIWNAKLNDWRNFEVNAIPILDQDNSLREWVGVINDITEVLKKEEELRDSEARLREAQAMTHVGNWYWDVKTGVVDCSEELYRILGLDPETSTPHIDMFMELSSHWPEDGQRHHEIMQRAIENREPGDFEQRFMRPDGSTGYSYSTFQGIYDDKGELTALKGTIQDISERKEADEALRLSEAKYRSLIESSPYCIHQINTEGQIISMNRAGLQTLNLENEDSVIGTPYVSYADTSEHQRILDLMDAAFTGKYEEFEFRSTNGLEFSSLFAPIYDADNKIHRLLGITQDISKRKAAEQALKQAHAELEQRVEERTRELNIARQEAEEANLAKSQFLANMSHELRTPLNAAIGYSELIMDEAIDREDMEYIPDLQKIHSASKHLLHLIDNILDLSKIEAGKMELFIEPFVIVTLVDEVRSVTQPLIEQNGNRLKIKCPKNVGVMHSDITKLRQVLFNLLSNAAKFTDKGEVYLEVKRHNDEIGEWITFLVKDTGIGMTAKQQAQVFDDFKQADLSTTKKFGGTGLGLTLCMDLCEMLGGDIKVESEVGKGTLFTVRLPAQL